MNNSFTKDDHQKLIDYLNMVATHAEFKMNTEQLIQYFKLLGHMQQHILPKVRDHIFEIERVIEPEEPEKKPKRKSNVKKDK